MDNPVIIIIDPNTSAIALSIHPIPENTITAHLQPNLMEEYVSDHYNRRGYKYFPLHRYFLPSGVHKYSIIYCSNIYFIISAIHSDIIL